MCQQADQPVSIIFVLDFFSDRKRVFFQILSIRYLIYLHIMEINRDLLLRDVKDVSTI